MKLPRYPKYKNSGVKWLGQVPEHWKVKRLRFVARLNPSKSEIKKIPNDTLVSFLPMEAIGDDGQLDLSRTKPLEEVSSGYTYFAEGDVTLAKITPCFENGKGALMTGLTAGIGFGTTELIVARPIVNAIESEYLACVFNSQTFRKLGESEMYGAGGQKRVPDDFVRNFYCGIPPQDERTRILQFIEIKIAKINALIEEQRRLIDLLREKRQAIISHAVTKGLNPDAPMKQSGVNWIGEIPEHWEIYRLTTLYREIIEAGNDELPILSVSIHSGVSDRQLDEDEMDRKVNRSEETAKYKKVLPGDLVYNMMRAWQGGFGTVTVPGQISPAYVVARPKRDFSSRFVELLLRTPQAIEEIRCHSYGVTDFRLRLYWDNFKIIRVALPPKEEQEKILGRIEKMNRKFDQLIEVSNSSIATLQERRAALISAAVTGQIDVRGESNAVQ